MLEKEQSFTAGEAFLSLSQTQTIRIHPQRENRTGQTWTHRREQSTVIINIKVWLPNINPLSPEEP